MCTRWHENKRAYSQKLNPLKCMAQPLSHTVCLFPYPRDLSDHAISIYLYPKATNFSVRFIYVNYVSQAQVA